MKRSEIISQLESECLPHFESIASELRSKHPEFRIVVGSGSVGGNTTFQGHHAYIDCDREGSANPEPNCIALEVCVRDLDHEPTLCTLDVGWGGDGVAPCETVDNLPGEVPWGQDAIDLIRLHLSSLESELDHCLTAWEDSYLNPQSA
jgi:hypothetical protein